MRERSRGWSGLEAFVGIYGNFCCCTGRRGEEEEVKEVEEEEKEEEEELEKLVEIWAGDLGL